jgi:hypothetical protein
MTKRAVHHSDIQQYKRCRRAWAWGSMHRANLTARKPYAAFYIGSAVHYALNEYYSVGNDPLDALEHYIANNIQTPLVNPDDLELTRAMLREYMLWRRYAPQTLHDNAFRFLENERAFNVPLRQAFGVNRYSRKVRLGGRRDGVVEHLDTGKLYLWELKTTRSLDERERQLAFDEQTLFYMLALQEEYKRPIAGAVYTLIRKAQPQTARVLKNGLLSTAQIDTTYQTYVAQIDAWHKCMSHDELASVIAQHYADRVEELRNQPHTFVRRVLVERSHAQLETYRRELWHVAHEMIAQQRIYAMPDQHCNYCTFRRPCLALNNGDDYQTILANEYVPNNYHLDTQEQ